MYNFHPVHLDQYLQQYSMYYLHLKVVNHGNTNFYNLHVAYLCCGALVVEAKPLVTLVFYSLKPALVGKPETSHLAFDQLPRVLEAEHLCFFPVEHCCSQYS